MNEFREFGISSETAFLLKKDFSFQNCKDFVAQYGRYLDPEPIHVIEYSALEQAEAKIKSLEAKLEIAVDALSDIATMKYGNSPTYTIMECMNFMANSALEKLRG